MSKVAMLVYVVAAPTMAGISMIATLVAGSPTNIMVSAIAAGFVLAIPASWLIAKSIAKI